MLSRRRVFWLAGLACLLSAIVPIVGALWWARGQAFEEASRELDRRAHVLAENASRVLDEVATGLEALAEAPLVCGDESILALRQVAFDVPEITETGLMDADGRLFCTSWGPVEPPIAFELEAIEGRMSLKGPVEAQVMGRPILVAEARRPGGGFVNALIQPRTLVGIASNEADDYSFVALLDQGLGNPYVALGLVPPMRDLVRPGEEALSIDFADRVARLVALQPVPGFPQLVAVAARSRASVDQAWQGSARLAGLAGLLVALPLSAAVFWVARRRLSLGGELQRALRRGELRVEYQPVVELRSGRCVGVEALLRWDHPEQGGIEPGLFVPLAESSGLMDQLTRHVLRSIEDDLGGHLRRDASFHVAINVWPGHLRDERLQGWLEGLLERVGMRARQVILELTERTLIADEDHVARDLLQELRRRGFRLALDDFGTGYSSLAYLETFDLDYLKIDKHFVGAIGSAALTAHLVEAIADLAHRLDLSVIAEGVETAEQRDKLASRDVEWAQGWLWAPALPAGELLDYLRRGPR